MAPAGRAAVAAAASLDPIAAARTMAGGGVAIRKGRRMQLVLSTKLHAATTHTEAIGREKRPPTQREARQTVHGLCHTCQSVGDVDRASGCRWQPAGLPL